jgi:photosystem II stability/assembly factor-like uncharacterized protein
MKISFIFILLLFIVGSLTNSQTIQWQQLNGPHGGTAISFASNESGDIFAGSYVTQNAVNRSTDGGHTWLMSSNGINDIGYRSVEAIYVTESNDIIIGTYSPNGSKIYRSTDNGNNWYVVSPDFGAKAFTSDNNGIIYAFGTAVGGLTGGMHKSTDEGVTWEQVTSVPGGTVQMDIAINDSGHIFITGYEILRSTDNGITWEDIGTGYIVPGVIVTSIAINDSGHIFVGSTQEYVSNSGILRSIDNGETWTQLKMGIRIDDHHNIVINSQGHIFAGSYGWGIWKSTDNGLNWAQHNNGFQHIYIRSMHISNGVLYAGTVGGGIYRSDDWAENWTQVGFSAAVVSKIAISPANENLFTAVSGVSRSTDSGQTWQPVNHGLADYETNSLAIKNDGTIFCCTKGSNQYYLPTVYRSTNNGNSWAVIDTGLSQYYSKNAIILDQQGDVYVTDNDAVYKSTNNGDSWFSIGGPGAAIGLAFNSNGDFFATNGQGIWRKLNGDTVWTQMASGYWFTYSLFIGSNNYIYSHKYRSTDNGETWTSMNIATEPTSFTENSLNHIFAGTRYEVSNTGVYISKDCGDTWALVNDGLSFPKILSLAVDPDGYLYAGTNGRSIFKTVNSTTTDVEEIKFEPKIFYLGQNYPNPFNPSTKISWQSPVGSHQTLKVFDVLGNEIATLVDEYKLAGRYEVEFSVHSDKGQNLSSGIYFYQLRILGPDINSANGQAGQGFIQTKKMLLIK